MRKGQATRQRIVDRAIASASQDGIDTLTIGALAAELGMSKSGLFTHFGSKEALQIEVVDETVRRFTEEVVRPALALPPGKNQLRRMFGDWVAWSFDDTRPGGCPLAAAAFDFDGQPGDVRQRLAENIALWRQVLRNAVEAAKAVDLAATVDSDDLVLRIIGLYFAQHLYHWLLDDNGAGDAALRSFEALLAGPDTP
ncbi:MAG: TetR/AcrR family transcriptional regulator [Inquilinus sp.]|nr:TetR/AcrR family transcriptional regulator [Inquilinus sp.]